MLILNEKVQRAINFANIKHNSQLRKGTENLYSVHPVSVGIILNCLKPLISYAGVVKIVCYMII